MHFAELLCCCYKPINGLYGELTKNDQETLDLLGQFFQEVFTKEDTSNIPTIQQPKYRWEDGEIESCAASVKSKLKRLFMDKSPGPDGIHPMLLRECAAAVAKHLSLIFAKSYETRSVPADWCIVPTFKKGSRTNRENYRPMSLTSVPCKVMESIIKDELLSYLEANRVITDSPWFHAW